MCVVVEDVVYVVLDGDDRWFWFHLPAYQIIAFFSSKMSSSKYELCPGIVVEDEVFLRYLGSTKFDVGHFSSHSKGGEV